MIFQNLSKFFRLNPEDDSVGVKGFFLPVGPQLLIVAALIAILAFATTWSKPVHAQPTYYMGGNYEPGFGDPGYPYPGHRPRPFMHHRGPSYMPGGMFYRSYGHGRISFGPATGYRLCTQVCNGQVRQWTQPLGTVCRP